MNTSKFRLNILLYGKKILTDFNDIDLLKLFKEIDEYEESDRKVAKNILKKLVKNIRRKKRIRKRNRLEKLPIKSNYPFKTQQQEK